MENLGWASAIGVSVAMLLFATPLSAVASILAVSAAWCFRIDDEEHRIQVIEPEVAELKR